MDHVLVSPPSPFQSTKEELILLGAQVVGHYGCGGAAGAMASAECRSIVRKGKVEVSEAIGKWLAPMSG